MKGMENEDKSGRYYLPHLDGMRGVVIMLVVFYHLGFSVTRHAWLCISTFFSLSGLLITGITVETFEKTGRIDIVRFWARRVARLFPALLLTVFMCASIAHARGLDNVEIYYERQDLLYGLAYLTNVNLVFWRKDDYFAGFRNPSITRHMWTLSIEEQYYIVWPVLFYVLTRCFGTRSKVLRAATLQKVQHDASALLLHVSEGDREIAIAKPQPIYETADMEEAEEQSQLVSETKISCVVEPELDTNAIHEMRPCLLALAAAEVAVITFSHVATIETIKDLGMSAAYYATWSRMGDFACGGLVFLLVRLTPSIYSRYSRKPNLEPMRTRDRVLLELLFLLCVCLLVFPPMIQIPLGEVLPFYFYKFRLPFSFSIMALSVAGAVQSSEALPRWALVTRAMTSQAMTTLGLISYGLYLFHWPIILSLGAPESQDSVQALGSDNAPIAAAEADAGKYGWQSMLRDWCLVLLSVAVGYFSHTRFEKPLMALGAKQHNPWKVVRAGISASLLMALYVVTVLAGGTDPNKSLENDWGSLDFSWEGGDLPHVISVTATQNRSTPELIDPATVNDTRHTPLFLLAGQSSRSPLTEILDSFSSPHPSLSVTHGIFNFIGNKHTSVDEIFEDYHDKHSKHSVMIMCKSVANLSPCDRSWKHGSHWVWLSHNLICGDTKHWEQNGTMAAASDAWERRCEKKMHVFELAMPDIDRAVTIDGMETGETTYSGRKSVDVILLMRMVLEVDALLGPGVINRHTIAQLRVDLKEAEEREMIRLQAVALKSLDWDGELKVTMLGESIAGAMANYFKELLELSLPCVHDQLATRDFPAVEITNLASGHANSILHFVPCSAPTACDPEEEEDRQRVLSAMAATKPQVVMVHDIHWHKGSPSGIAGGALRSYGSPEEDYEVRAQAMVSMLAEARRQGVRQVMFLTSSPFNHHPGFDKVEFQEHELQMLEHVAQLLACQPGEQGRGIIFSVMYWHYLNCPSWPNTHCPKDVHGFEDIMPDNLHPRGSSGEWSSAQALSVLLAQIAASQLPGYSSFAEALGNPVSSCLQTVLPSDGEPPLDELYRDYLVCPP